jgi:YbbR domain-containing protein
LVRLDKNKLLLLISSFIISIFLYVFITGEQSIEGERIVTFEVSPPEGMVLIGGNARPVKLLLSAPRNIFALVATADFSGSYVIDDKVEAGNYSFDISERDFDLPHRGVKIVDINPQRLTVTLDEVKVKKLNVKANIVGEPAEGYRIDFDNISIDPTATLVKGPHSVLLETETIMTEPINVVGRSRSFRSRVSLQASKEYEVQSEEPIEVMVSIKQEGFERVIENVSINVMHAATKNFSVSVEPSTIHLKLKGPKNILTKLDKKNVLAYVNVAELSRGEYQLPLMVYVHPDVSLVGDVPIVKVVIEESMEKMKVAPSLLPDIAQPEEEK